MSRTTKRPYKEIVEKHLKGATVHELAKEYSIPRVSIYMYFHKNGIKTIPMKVERRKYIVNEGILDKIQNEQQSYFLGIMMSDGYIGITSYKGYTYKNFGLKLKAEDFELINQICNFLGLANPPILKRDTGFNFISKGIVEKLEENGIVHRKTYKKLKIPLLDKSLVRHFIRGYFDGDGSVSIRNSRKRQIQVYICGICKSFLEEIQKILEAESIYSIIYCEKRQSKGFRDMYTLRITTHKDRKKFFDYMYQGNTICLRRKYDKYKVYYDNTEIIEESKNFSTS